LISADDVSLFDFMSKKVSEKAVTEQQAYSKFHGTTPFPQNYAAFSQLCGIRSLSRANREDMQNLLPRASRNCLRYTFNDLRGPSRLDSRTFKGLD